MPKVMQPTLSETVLNETMYLFWQKGFFNTSIEDIIETTGFNRAAIYKYFGGKEELFLAMLKRYRKEITHQFTAQLQNQQSGINGIQNFFYGLLQTYQADHMPNGCFLISTASDIPSHHQNVANFIEEFLQFLRNLFLNLLNYEKLTKQIKSEMTIETIADFLVGNVFGLFTLCRSSAPKVVFENHITGILHFLKTLTTKKSSKLKVSSTFINLKGVKYAQ